jgi:predicted nucleic acid-binding protein
VSLRYLIDTNVLVYPHDVSEPTKAARAADLLRRARVAGTAALPAQVLAELASVLLKKMKPRLSPEAVEARIDGYEQAFPVLPLTGAIVREAVRGVREHKFSYYDAQLWAAARLAQIPMILSEDFNTGSRIEGVLFLDPFDPAFEVHRL